MTSQMSGPRWRGGLYCCLAAALFCLAAADERSHKVRPELGSERRLLPWHAALLEPAGQHSMHCRSSLANHVALPHSVQYSVAEPVRIWVNKAGPYNK